MVSLALGASIFSMFYFLSLYMQHVLGIPALKTGVGYLAIAARSSWRPEQLNRWSPSSASEP